MRKEKVKKLNLVRILILPCAFRNPFYKETTLFLFKFKWTLNLQMDIEYVRLLSAYLT